MSRSCPTPLESAEDRADYIHGICSTWNFGIVPEPETFRLFRTWRGVFDAYPLPHSPAYHAFRAWFGWPATEKGTIIETYAERLDRRAGRDDPCASML
jgi:hypothetical protein